MKHDLSDLLQFTLNRLHPDFAEFHFNARCDAMRYRYKTNLVKILYEYLRFRMQ